LIRTSATWKTRF